jgi:methylglutaconyl-CoA hydratase
LGIAPAVISPYVVAKIGIGHARALFLTAERFNVERALRIGLVHSAVPMAELDAEVERIVGELKTSAPAAITGAKQLLARLPQLDSASAMKFTTETIAQLRVGEEGQSGLRAFLDKTRAPWLED